MSVENWPCPNYVMSHNIVYNFKVSYSQSHSIRCSGEIYVVSRTRIVIGKRSFLGLWLSVEFSQEIQI
jgi:hypothetical protein